MGLPPVKGPVVIYYRGPIPGTHEPGFEEQPFRQQAVSEIVKSAMARHQATNISQWFMGECSIIRDRETLEDGESYWHLSISHPTRHPTWDEIKVARYRLLPPDLDCAMYLPPVEEYVNVPEQDHVFHVWQTPQS